MSDDGDQDAWEALDEAEDEYQKTQGSFSGSADFLRPSPKVFSEDTGTSGCCTNN